MKESTQIANVSKEKRDVTIKSNGCTYGVSQREYTSKTETGLHTVIHEAMIISCSIDANVV